MKSSVYDMSLTKEQIEWCNTFIEQEWWVNMKGEVEVEGNLVLLPLTNMGRDFDKFPVQFADMKGYFQCVMTNITSLEGAPSRVERFFSCDYSPKLTSLKGAPIYVGGNFICTYCPKVPQDEIDLLKNSRDLFFDWLKTGLSLKEYQTKYSAKITGSKFGL